MDVLCDSSRFTSDLVLARPTGTGEFTWSLIKASLSCSLPQSNSGILAALVLANRPMDPNGKIILDLANLEQRLNQVRADV